MAGIFSGRDAIIRLAGGQLAEQSDEWTEPATIWAWKSSLPAGKAAQADVGQNITSEAESIAEAVPA